MPLSWGLLVLGLCLSGLVAWQVDRQAQDAANQSWQEASRITATAIERRLNEYRAALVSLQGLYNTYGLIPQQEAVQFLAAINESGDPARPNRLPGFILLDYQAAPQASGQLPVYHPPQDGVAHDIHDGPSAPQRRNIQLMTRDSPGNPMLRTATVQGPDSPAPHPGLVLRLPVYRSNAPLETPEQRREAYLGTVNAWLDIPVMLQDVLRESAPPGLAIRLYALQAPLSPGEAMSRSVLFDSADKHAGIHDSALRRQLSLQFAGSGLELQISGDEAIWQPRRWVSVLVLAIGTLLSLMVFFLVRLRLERRLNAHRLELAHYSRLTTLGEMASAIAHEVRQPLAAVQAYLDGCRHKYQQSRLQMDDLPLLLEKMSTQTQRAQDIVGRVQAAVRREKAVSQPPERIAAASLVRRAVSLARMEAEQAGVELHEKEMGPFDLNVVAMDIELILLNLLRNAIHACQGNPSPRVTISGSSDEHGLAITVTDNGPGIPPEVMRTLFEAHRTTKQDGSGMGLRISRFLAEINGGTLTAGNLPEGGAIFVLMFSGEVTRDQG